MKIETKPVVTFTEKEYEAFNEVCMILDDLISVTDGTAAFDSIVKESENEINPYIFYDTFATITNYVENHREE